MKYLLDTNTCIAAIRNNPPRVRERVSDQEAAGLRVCAPTVAELLIGAVRSNDPAYERSRVDDFLADVGCLPFDEDAAVEYVRIRVALEAAGTPIGSFDTMIAAVGRAYGLTVVTHNTREFARVPGLRIEDWQSP